VGTTTTSSTGPVSIPWDTTTVADGSQTLTAAVKDATGNTGGKALGRCIGDKVIERYRATHAQ